MLKYHFINSNSVATIEVKKHWKLIILTIIITITGIFFIRPAVLGYSVYQDLEKTNLTVQEYAKSIDEIQEELHVVNASLTNYFVFNEQLLSQVDEMSNDIATKSAEIGHLETKLEESEKFHAQQLQELQDELKGQEDDANEQISQSKAQLQNLTNTYTQNLNQKVQEMQQLLDQYDLFISQTARSICCKEKVDDSSINSYEIVNNRILCLNNGNRTLSC